MLVGIDFDNTIVCYDRLFHRLAVERGLIPASAPVNKIAIRDQLRRMDREDDWTELQGIAYGPRIAEAEPFPGALDFFATCKAAGIRTAIISHKTRHPYRGEKYDLHEAAHTFLTRHGFYKSSDTGLSPLAVWLELTKERKLDRIGGIGCNLFVDDLPEFLGEPAFPAPTRKVLFDPANGSPDCTEYSRVKTWGEITTLVLRAAKGEQWAA